MEIVFPYAAALDIGKKQTVAAIHTPACQQTRSFSMMTRELLEMADWLEAHQVTHVAMESTGVYWKPIFNLLEGYDFALLLVNPREFRSVPGRESGVKDAEWLAELLRHGLLQGSFVPDRTQRELREVVRYRRKLIEERGREYNRLEKTLEGANIKLGAVASTMTGKSVRAMLWALIEGRTDLDAVADLAKGRLRRKRAELVEALRGLVGPHQQFMLREQLGHIDDLDGRIERLDAEVAERLRPSREAPKAPGDDSRLGTAHGRGSHRRDRLCHEPLPQRQASGLLGEARSGPK